MTNKEKFIEMMNETFDAKMTPENVEAGCSPCGLLKKYESACATFDCDRCNQWWDEEYKQP